MLQRRFDLIRAVIGERTTTSEAARELGIARVNMQSLVHRAEAAILSAMAPRPSGPPPKSDEEKKLEARIAQLERENARLKTQLQAADDMMGAAGEIIRALRGLPPTKSKTSSQTPSPSTTTTNVNGEDP